jgi:tyrosinase
MSNEPPPKASRYQRFREIMTAAAQGSSAAYDGYGSFWNLPLPELRALSLYGVPMFLGNDPSRPHSGAQSGIVRGLRGAYPFDETLFPRLPWGGRVVPDPDIALIESWIDAGCPESDDDAAGRDPAELAALASGAAAHPVHAEPVNAFFAKTGSIKQRKNVNELSAEELRRYRDAVAWMKKFDRYYLDERSFGYWARIHASQCQHGWEQFLTWHRAYLYNFELKLQDFDPSVTIPYWDWTDDSKDDVLISVQDMNAKAGQDNGVIPAAFRCWIEEQSLRNLEGKVTPGVLAALRTMIGAEPCNSGSRFFTAAGIAYGENPQSDRAIVAELERVNPLFHWRRWPGGNADLIFEAYPTQNDVDTIMKIENFFTFGSGSTDDQFFGALENIHNLIHNFTGGVNPNYKYDPSSEEARDDPSNPDNTLDPAFGDMQNGAFTAFDPIFWSHHSNVDRLWGQWQSLHPNATPDDPTAPLPPFNLTVADTYSPRKLGYEYCARTHLFLTDGDTAIRRFRSAVVPVPAEIVAQRRRAEIRVHTVQYVERGGYHVRAFLNAPEADATTPTSDQRYVGQVNILTGLCIGGPGHCAVPQRPSNRFDKRPRHHKTPSNLRFDATETVRRLSANGATDFHVNLVVLNTDGTLAQDALYIDGVSLNFFD